MEAEIGKYNLSLQFYAVAGCLDLWYDLGNDYE